MLRGLLLYRHWALSEKTTCRVAKAAENCSQAWAMATLARGGSASDVRAEYKLKRHLSLAGLSLFLPVHHLAAHASLTIHLLYPAYDIKVSQPIHS